MRIVEIHVGVNEVLGGAQTCAYQYTYNNHNWLTQANFGTVTGSAFAIDPAGKFQEGGLQYDANGNITSLIRNAASAMDNLAYTYLPNSNKLDYVTDQVGTSGVTDDITSQTTGNYAYNAIGQLSGNIKDNQFFTYDVYGHVSTIKKSDGSTWAANTYDDKGFRIKKTDGVATSWYVRDASGNILATYYKDATNPVHLNEINLFGASRIGMAQANTSGTLNKYVYELSNHLGNLRATVPKDATSTLNLESYSDYYPFGLQYSPVAPDNDNKYLYNGKELQSKEFGVTGLNWLDYGKRFYDPQIGRRHNVDPIFEKAFDLTPYRYAQNNPIRIFDPNGIHDFFDFNGNLI